MPELPEVQTVVNGLTKKISGKVFSDAKISVKKMVSTNLKKDIKNKKVKRVIRREPNDNM